jgi:dienelactone hydrolase
MNAYARQVHDRYVALVREIRRERRARLDSIRTRRQARAYQERVREAIARAFAPMPRRTPLDARIAGAIELPGLRIEKLLFSSRPGCLVTANLYLPLARGAGPLPAVLADCGHALAGKAYPEYQEFPRRLAAAGFATLLIEPFAQGERDQHARLPPELRAGLSDDCCAAHNLIGQQLELVGESFGAWRAWDGMRGLDYLLSRPEIDPRHVGVTGHSGGGTMTAILWALDRRLTMAAPSCAITTFAANLENEIPADCEQCPPGLIAAGLEQADLLIARAPEPSLLLGQQFDFFDRRGLREAHREIARFHELLGAPAGGHRLVMDQGEHSFSTRHQLAMVDFFHRVARGSAAPRAARGVFAPLAEAELRVTPSGVIDAGGAPAYELIAERALALAKRRRRASGSRLAPILRQVLALPPRASSPPALRILRPRAYPALTCARYGIETEDGIVAVLHRPRPEHAQALEVPPRPTLYLPHLASEHELADPALAGGLVGRVPLFLLDPRGLGESRPPGEFFTRYGLDYMHHAHGLMLARPVLGQRVHDVLRAIDLLTAEGARRVDLVGRGQGAILALHAAILAGERVGTVALRHAPGSYLEWATAPVVRWPAANAPRGVLACYDLPDLVRQLGRRLTVSEPWDSLMEPAER